ncbi:hypothetical protein ACIBTZ_11340 [Micromonospora sp. NPDC049460]|uniref:hypothetical protein n=1 Tax=unclassified Micromonospora TaxID=2617518 RepID=UPI0037161923
MSSDPSSLPESHDDGPHTQPPVSMDELMDLLAEFRSASDSADRDPEVAQLGGGDVVTVEMLATAMVWISGAVGAGMLGNSAYDAFKVAISRLLHRDPGGEAKPLSQAQAVEIARKALQDRVTQAEVVDFPDVATMRVAEWSLSDSGWSITLQRGGIDAQVEIPTDVAGKDGVYVKVRVAETRLRKR